MCVCIWMCERNRHKHIYLSVETNVIHVQLNVLCVTVSVLLAVYCAYPTQYNPRQESKQTNERTNKRKQCSTHIIITVHDGAAVAVAVWSYPGQEMAWADEHLVFLYENTHRIHIECMFIFLILTITQPKS